MGTLTSFKKLTVGRVTLPAILSLSALPLVSTAVYGQDMVLEEIIITAQKREQNAMTVPITVDTFSSRDIEVTGAQDIKGVEAYIPGFEAGDGVTQVGLTIRGVSSSNISSGGDPSVATFYDEVYLPQAASTVTFSDMARIEILKGPQGTLFGRNAAAGVVNMVPNQPAADLEGFVSARLGNYDLTRFEGMINAPLTDDLFMRANIYTNERDGYIQNVSPGGDDVGAEDNQAARIAFLWNITGATNLQVSYDYDKVDNAPRGSVGIGEFAYSDDPFSGKMENDVIKGRETRDMYAVTAKLNHEFNDNFSMKYIASYRDWDTHNREDEDGTGNITTYLDVDTAYDADIFYNEVQFHFVNETFDWISGASYSSEHVQQRLETTLLTDSEARFVTNGLNQTLGSDYDYYWDPAEFADALNTYVGQNVTAQDVAAANGTPADYYDLVSALLGDTAIFGPVPWAGELWQERIDNDGDLYNWGVFTDVDVTITDSFNVIAGLRYSKDQKDYSWYTPVNSFAALKPGTNNIIFGVSPGEVVGQEVKATEEWDKVTGRLVGTYQFAAEAMTFLSYSTGYKSGGFDSLSQVSAVSPFDAEDVTNYEWGIKGTLLDNHLRTQLSVFRMEVDNRQRSVDQLNPGDIAARPGIINGDQTIDGVEVTLDWIVIDTLRLGAITTYRDVTSEWDDYYNNVGILESEKESDTTNAEFTLTLDWTPVIPFGEMLFHVDYVFQEQGLEENPNHQDIYNGIENYNQDLKFLNARVAWYSDDGHYEMAVWGQNLLDNQYTSVPGGLAASPDTLGAAYVTINPPLTYGVDLKYMF